MVTTNILGPHVLNAYVWELIQANFGASTAQYGGRVPIVPASMEPSLTPYDKPFIVYGFSEDSTPDLFERRGGSLSYAVWSTSENTINNWMNTIRLAMERRDEPAREVNNWSSTQPHFDGIRFGEIHVGYFESPSPEETEGGRKVGVITLRYEYFTRYNPIKVYHPDYGFTVFRSVHTADTTDIGVQDASEEA